MSNSTASRLAFFFFLFSYPSICIILFQEAKRIYSKHGGDRWLQLWSTLSIIFFLFAAIFGLLHKMPHWCADIHMIGPILWVLGQYTVTMYQTRKLQYISNQLNIYSNNIFISFAVSGTIVFVAVTIYFSFFAYGVIHHGQSGCQMTFKKHFFILAPLSLSFVMLWDLTVLTLFIHLLCKLTGNKENITLEKQKRIQYTLRKIVSLTVLYDILTISNVAIFAFSNNPILSTAMHQIDTFMSAVIVFLMIEDNDEFYRKFICCCVSKLLQNNFQEISAKESDDATDSDTDQEKSIPTKPAIAPSNNSKHVESSTKTTTTASTTQSYDYSHTSFQQLEVITEQ